MAFRSKLLAALSFGLALAGQPVEAQSGVRVAVAYRPGELRGLEADGVSRLQSAAIDREGRSYVLDAARNEVLAFDSAGALVARVGGSGTTFGKFRVARAVTVDDDGSVIILDPAMRRATAFRWTGTALTAHDTIPVATPGVAMCAMDSVLYVFAHREGRIVHAFDRRRGAARSFGEVFEPGSRLVQQHHADGPIVCDRARGQVVVASALLLKVRAYSPAGVLKWERALEGVPRVQVSESSPGAVDLKALDPAAATATSMVLLQPDHLVVHLRSGPMERDASVHQRVLSATTGAVTGTHASAPEVVAARGPRVVVVSRWERVVPRLGSVSVAR